jgi:hypothetical protein
LNFMAVTSIISFHYHQEQWGAVVEHHPYLILARC